MVYVINQLKKKKKILAMTKIIKDNTVIGDKNLPTDMDKNDNNQQQMTSDVMIIPAYQQPSTRLPARPDISQTEGPDRK